MLELLQGRRVYVALNARCSSFIEIRDLRRQLEGACHEIETLQRQPEQRSAA